MNRNTCFKPGMDPGSNSVLFKMKFICHSYFDFIPSKASKLEHRKATNKLKKL